MPSDRAGSVSRAPSALVYGHAPRTGWLLGSAASAGAALAAGLLLGSVLSRKRADTGPLDGNQPRRRRAVSRLRHGSAILAASVLSDSALEHYRARFQRKPMVLAPAVAAATLATSAGAPSEHRVTHGLRAATLVTAFGTGVLGAAFHVYNLLKRPSALHKPGGSFNWLNLFYAAPLGAPLALTLAGAFGLLSQRVAAGGDRSSTPGEASARRLGAPLGALASVGLFGNVAEVWLLHFRGAFQNPFMFVPLVVPPAAATLLLGSALARRPMRGTATLLEATLATGLAGVGFHSYGIRRNMGGFHNLSQMILQGPPVPAPPAFTGLALAGLAALDLMEHPA